MPYVATFFVFTDYMRPSIRLAAIMGVPVVYVFTHDSIGLGEDGPTHQPVEQLAALRAMPNSTLIRPADANETVEAWKVALAATDGPVGPRAHAAEGADPRSRPLRCRRRARARRLRARRRTAARRTDAPDLILLASGSEVQLAAAAPALPPKAVRSRVVAVPCWELFDAQDADYRERVLPASVTPRLAVEAGVSFGWRDLVGLDGDVVGLDRFGASAPAGVCSSTSASPVCERARERAGA